VHYYEGIFSINVFNSSISMRCSNEGIKNLP
jgi:hypothetical protein